MLKLDYPEIRYCVVLASFPEEESVYSSEDFSDTICPFLFDKIPPKHAMVKRNKWMINNSEYVVTYVNRPFGGAAALKELAVKKGKTVIELSKST